METHGSKPTALWDCLIGRLVILFVLFSAILKPVSNHGRLIEPPSRSSMWRFGYPTPKNYLDNELFCGGFTHQWSTNAGKCGVCGDPWEGPRQNEAGGKYATGIIVRRYKRSAVMRVVVEITAPHKGWFEFRICPNNDPSKPVTHDCLDRYVLPLAGGSGTKYYLGSGGPGAYTVLLKLPPTLTCSQCVLQWKYNAGNNWGTDASGKSCLGCGQQEQFYGCSDIAVDDRTSQNVAEASITSEPLHDVGKGSTKTTSEPLQDVGKASTKTTSEPLQDVGKASTKTTSGEPKHSRKSETNYNLYKEVHVIHNILSQSFFKEILSRKGNGTFSDITKDDYNKHGTVQKKQHTETLFTTSLPKHVLFDIFFSKKN